MAIDALRTSEARFDFLADYSFQPRYRDDLAGLEGLRMTTSTREPTTEGSLYVFMASRAGAIRTGR